ncbi:MAG: hypothetical protein E6271_01310 [Negativicoccus succinicivorans]|nr:hypothetical protein [Negativicoccus succinicivorans]
MAATAEQWEAYQAVKALLRRDQQNVLSEIEWYMANTEPGAMLAEVDVFNERVNALRGRYYSPVANHHFLLKLGIIDISAPKWSTVQGPFDGVRLYRGRYGWRLAIRISDYFLRVIGAYIRDEKGA